MTDAEIDACKVLERADGRRTETEDEDVSDSTCMQRLKRENRSKSMGTRKHVDYNFIVGYCT